MITQKAAFEAARSEMTGPQQWGVRDCCTAACAAWARLHGHDPLSAFEGRYSSATSAARILRQSGGYLRWCDETFKAAGLLPCRGTEVGDLVLVATQGLFGSALALALGEGRIASKTENGMAIAVAPIVGGWAWAS